MIKIITGPGEDPKQIEQIYIDQAQRNRSKVLALRGKIKEEMAALRLELEAGGCEEPYLSKSLENFEKRSKKELRDDIYLMVRSMNAGETSHMLLDARYHTAKHEIMYVLYVLEVKLGRFRRAHEALSHVLEVCHDHFGAFYAHFQAIECILRYPDTELNDFEMMQFHTRECISLLLEMPHEQQVIIQQLTKKKEPLAMLRGILEIRPPSAPSPSPAVPWTPTGPQES